jgi:hypothetical protein
MKKKEALSSCIRKGNSFYFKMGKLRVGKERKYHLQVYLEG